MRNMQKTTLSKLQRLIPIHFLSAIQYIHACLISHWILRWGSQPIALTTAPVMVFSPHQDDETFGCGGMIARKRQQAIRVGVVFLTEGRGSHGLEPNIQNQVMQIRQQESLQALEILGVPQTEIKFLNREDGSLLDLNISQKTELISEIVTLLRDYQPGEVYVPHFKDCHRDHEATYSLVKEAIAESGISVEILQYPIWIFWRAPLFILLKLRDIAPAYRLSVAQVQSQKQQAIAAYSSQIATLPRGFIKRFLQAEEIFFKTEY